MNWRHCVVQRLPISAVTLLALLLASPTYGQDTCATHTTALEHSFDSGSAWHLCWHIDDTVGLVLTNIHYSAPGNPSRKILDSANLATLLIHFDEDSAAIDLLGQAAAEQDLQLPMSADNCRGTVLTASQVITNQAPEQLCAEDRLQGNLTRYANLPVLQRHALILSASSRVNSYNVRHQFTLTEDGNIKPAIDFSGRIARFTTDLAFGSSVNRELDLASNATLYYVWRLDFNINNTPNNDLVDEYQFDHDGTDRERKLQQRSRLSVEQFRKVSAENFRGWHIYDADQSSVDQGFTRIGYYLDPQQSGYRYLNPSLNWTQFDFFLTNKKSCEQLAINNTPNSAQTQHRNCAADLDGFVNGELTDGADPVIWYSLARRFRPASADWPAIVSRRAEFSLIPFDWSASSPFSDVRDGAP